jgi:hypothetical protein
MHILTFLRAYLHAYFMVFKCITIRSLIMIALYTSCLVGNELVPSLTKNTASDYIIFFCNLYFLQYIFFTKFCVFHFDIFVGKYTKIYKIFQVFHCNRGTVASAVIQAIGSRMNEETLMKGTHPMIRKGQFGICIKLVLTIGHCLHILVNHKSYLSGINWLDCCNLI